MSTTSQEAVVLERLIPDLESQGYKVFAHPQKQIVPAFLGTYLPDLIAFRDDKNLVFEIKSKTSGSDRFIQDLARRFEGRPDWEFRVVWINPRDEQRALVVQDMQSISDRTDEISKLMEGGFTGPALLLAWATFEALGRTLMEHDFSKPQSPGRLVQVLAKEGLVTPNEADHLRQLGEKRNRFIHGELSIQINSSEITEFLNILRTLQKTQMPQS